MYRFYLSLIVTLFTGCNNNNLLKEVKQFDNYPSASGIEYFNKKFYIIGDDANSLLVLDSNLNAIDSIQLYSFFGKRIPKAVKPDIESVTITKDNKLLLLGSGSSYPTRNIAWLINPVTKQKESIRLDTFYQRLTLNGIKEINIEGVCSIPGAVILANRGSKSYPKNHLIITKNNFWNDQANTPLTVIHTGFSSDSTLFNGISGLAYAEKSDRLLLTISTEDTHNTTDDGVIGKSYLWIIKNITSKKNWNAINPDEIIDLTAMDTRFHRKKIESVCITKETRNFLHLMLLADDENGSSTIFRMIAEKK